jgi:hypothetical protein
MVKRSSVAVVIAILAGFMVAGISAAGALENASPARIIKVQSNACDCRGDCFDEIDCSDFCASTCRGQCAVRYRNALNACLRQCGRAGRCFPR